ncbi:hypothetical protein C2I36_15000 [Rhodobacteraceae bacterium WD3A24]|nr:hypothetical protein C2I36_15000 [Rhodobacteraceae bacterium WD3A24]
MTKLSTFTVVGAAALMMGGAAFADGANPYDQIGDDNPAFSETDNNSIENDNNPGLRFGSGGGVVVPGNAGENANDNSVVDEHSTGETIVRPRGRK